MFTYVRGVIGKQGRSGQNLAEFALIVPVFMLLIFGIIECGRLYFTYSVLTSAAREGARFAITDPTNTTGIRNQVVSKAVGLSLPSGNVTVTCNPCTAPNPIRVNVTYSFQTLASFVLPNLTLNTAATMYIE